MTRPTQEHLRPLTIGDVAVLVGCSTDTVRRHHVHWTRTNGFPAPIALVGVRGLRWSHAAVMAWQLQRASTGGEAATDWAALAEARGAMLDAGLDPDAAAVPTLAAFP